MILAKCCARGLSNVPILARSDVSITVRSVTSRPAITTSHSAPNTMSAASGSLMMLASAAGEALPPTNAFPPIRTIPASFDDKVGSS